MAHLRRRIERLEDTRTASADPFAHVPFSVLRGGGDPGGVRIAGQWLTWDEYEAKYPDAPKPLRWMDE